MNPKLFPELFSEGDWKVRKSDKQEHGHTNPAQKILEVPYGETEAEQYIRLHELAHVKWSPTFEEVGLILERAGIPTSVKSVRDLVKMIEDGRINHLLGKAGFRDMKGATDFYNSTRKPPDQQDWSEQIQTATWMGMVAQGIIPRYTQEDMARLRKETPLLAAAVRHIRQLYEKNASKGFEACIIPILKLLWKAQEQQEQQAQEGEGGEPQGGEGVPQEGDAEGGTPIPSELGEATSQGTIMVAIPAEILEQEMPPEPEQKPTPQQITSVTDQQAVEEFVNVGMGAEYVRSLLAQDKEIRSGHYMRGGVYEGWGDATFEEPKRPKLITKKPALKHSFSDSGQLLRQVHRQPIDGMIYVEPRRNFRKGSMMIDCSGSMHLSVEEIRDIVLACPGMLVAGYAGGHADGIIRVFAKDGKMVDDKGLNIGMGGNTVDLPALQWLAKQKLPRFWISDGYVVGRNSCQAASLFDEVIAFTRRHRILRVPNLDEFKLHCMKYRL